MMRSSVPLLLCCLALLRPAAAVPQAGAPPRRLQEVPAAGCISAASCEKLRRDSGQQAAWSTGGGDPAVCGESDDGFADACTEDGWVQAQAVCYEAGARLCTIDELLAGETTGSGCGHDNRQTWSATACEGAEGMQTVLGNAGGASQCQPDLTASLAVRCCADAEGANGLGCGASSLSAMRQDCLRRGKSVCDVYAAGSSGCTSSLTCAELSRRDSAGERTQLGPATAWPTAGGSPTVCGESNAGFGPAFTAQCYGAESYEDAYAVCVRSGARLCTVEEIQADETRGTGCNHDLTMIWSSDDVGCDNEQHVQAPGSVTCTQCVGELADRVPACQADSEDGAVRCCADAYVDVPCSLSAPENLDQLPGVTVALGTSVDTVSDAPLCDTPGCGFRGGDASTIIDMSHAPDEWTTSPNNNAAHPDCSTRLYVTIDLQANYLVDGVTIWHYHGDVRSYCSQKVALSSTGEFNGEEVVVFDTGTEYG